ncbi:MAG: hypothetical protein QXS76_00235 [Candidatus Bathyarchaeia archaeon]
MKTKGKLHYVFLGISLLCFALYISPFALPLQLEAKSLGTMSISSIDDMALMLAGRIWAIFDKGYRSSSDGISWVQKIPLEIPIQFMEGDRAYSIQHSPYYVPLGTLAYRGESIYFADIPINDVFIEVEGVRPIEVVKGGQGKSQLFAKSGNNLYIIDIETGAVFISTDGGSTWRPHTTSVRKGTRIMLPIGNGRAMAIAPASPPYYYLIAPNAIVGDMIDQVSGASYMRLATDSSSNSAILVYLKPSVVSGATVSYEIWAILWNGAWGDPIKIADYLGPMYSDNRFAVARINGGWAVFWIDDRGQGLWKNLILCRMITDSGVISFNEEWGGPMLVTGWGRNIVKLIASPTWFPAPNDVIHLLWAEDIGGSKVSLQYLSFAPPSGVVVTTTTTTVTSITTTLTATATATTSQQAITPATTATTTTSATTTVITMTYTIGTTTITLGTEVITSQILMTTEVPAIIMPTPPTAKGGIQKDAFLWAGLASAIGAIASWPTGRRR